jgi:hypothetical protein
VVTREPEVARAPPPARYEAEPKEKLVTRPSGSGTTFEGVTDEVRTLMDVATKYHINVGNASQTLARVTQLLRVEEGERARTLASEAIEQLRTAIAEASQKRIDDMKNTLERLGPFAPRILPGKMETMDMALVRGDFDTLLPEVEAMSKEVANHVKSLGVTGRLIHTLTAMEAAIVTYGGKPSSVESMVVKAHEAFIKGQTKDAEAILGIALGEEVELLSPLMVTRLSNVSLRLKGAHEKGKDVRDLAVLMKQAVFSLRSRNLMQVLTLLPTLESKLDGMEEEAKPVEETKPEPAEPSETRVKRIKGHGRAVSSTAVPSAEPAPTTKGERPQIKKGCTYLLFEAHVTESMEVFLEAKGSGKGLVLTTTFPPKIVDDMPLPDTEIVWISDSSGWKETVHPKTLDHEISAYIFDFLREEGGTAIAIDGLGYLITSNGFARVEKFLKSILDFASSKKVTMVVTIQPQSLETKDVAALKGMFDFSY